MASGNHASTCEYRSSGGSAIILNAERPVQLSIINYTRVYILQHHYPMATEGHLVIMLVYRHLSEHSRAKSSTMAMFSLSITEPVGLPGLMMQMALTVVP